jgi:hypothetical protein
MPKHRIWKSAIAGLCGSVAHLLLMYFKSASGLLPAFQPYHSLQLALGQWTGSDIDPLVPWLLSFLNGSIFVGFAFGRSYVWLPGGNGATKGLLFGMLMWFAMGSIFFPLIGLGIFATGIGLGGWPALFSLAMLLSYSIVMGAVYEALGA